MLAAPPSFWTGERQSVAGPMEMRMPELESLTSDTPIQQVMDVLNRDGAVILTRLMSPAQIDGVLEELSPYISVTHPGRETFSGFKTTRTGALAARSKKVRAAILDRRIRAICDEVLLPNCERY